MLAKGLKQLGFKIQTAKLSSTRCEWKLRKKTAAEIVKLAEAQRINLRMIDAHAVGISLDETTTGKGCWRTCSSCLTAANAGLFHPRTGRAGRRRSIPRRLRARSRYLTHPVFNRYHSETEMLRYLQRLESRDLSLTTSMIPLGSCTMKLNATVEMFPVSWPEFGQLHPFAPLRQTQGYQTLFPATGGMAGGDHGLRGDFACNRTPARRANTRACWSFANIIEAAAKAIATSVSFRTSAHGTNPASAVMAGMKVVRGGVRRRRQHRRG